MELITGMDEAGAIGATVSIAPLPEKCKQTNSVSGLNVLIPVSERFRTAVDYSSYKLILKSQRYDDDVASEMQRMRKKVDN